MAEITCPVCTATATPALRIGAVAICGACGASLIEGGDGVRRAMAADTADLLAADLLQLRRAKGVVTRARR